MIGNLSSVRANYEPSCWDQIRDRIYTMQNQIFGLCSTDTKIYTLLIAGRILQAAAVTGAIIAVSSVFFFSPITLFGLIPPLLIGLLGTYIAGNPEQVYSDLQMARPFVTGQPVGLVNGGNNCWINSSIQLLMNAPHLHARMRQIPAFAQVMDAYAQTTQNREKVVTGINTQTIRQFLSEQTHLIDTTASQQDAAQLFEYLFQGPHSLYHFEQTLDAAPAIVRSEPMIKVNLGRAPRPDFQQLLQNHFDSTTSAGQRLQLFFPRSPDDLLIQFNRFIQFVNPAGVLVQEKINDPVDIPLSLNLPATVVRTAESASYRCNGFIIHSGASQNGGHYIAYIKKGNSWWYVSDTRTFEVNEQEATQQIKFAYITHYSKG